MTLPPPEPAARDRIVELLAGHYAADRLSETDLEARLDRVYRATTERELQAIVADLPAPAPAGAANVPAVPDARRRIVALLSGQERRITETVPQDLRLRARLGYVELDLTEARFVAGVTTIDVRAFLGYVQIRLPAGVRVESHGRALCGFFAHKGAPAPDASRDAPVVRIVGRALCGFAESYSEA